MSFFYDIFKNFNIDDLSTKTTVSIILGVGLSIVGKIKIISLGEEQIILESHKDRITIDGNNLKINSVSKGELVVAGKIFNLAFGGEK